MKNIIIILFFLFISKLSAQDTIYQVNIGMPIDNKCSFLKKGDDGRFMAGGYISYINSLLNPYFKTAIVKFNEYGIIQWKKQYQIGEGFLRPKDIYQQNDITIIGLNYLFMDTGTFVLMSVDTLGQILNQISVSKDSVLFGIGMSKIYKGLNDVYCIEIGGKLPNETYGDIGLIKLDSSFNLINVNLYHSTGNKLIYDMCSSLDGGSIFAFRMDDTISMSTIPSQGGLMKVDSIGNVVWAYQYNGGALISFNSILPLEDGGFAVCGSTSEPNKYSALLLKIDSVGNVVWSNEYSMDGFGDCFSRTIDCGFILSGSMFLGGGEGTYLLKTDSVGNPLWMHYGGLGDDPEGIEQTADGGYLYIDNGFNNLGDSQLHIVKTDSMGNAGCYDFTFPVTSHPGLVRTPLTFTRVPWQVTISPGLVQVDTTSLPDSVICTGVSGIVNHSKSNHVLELYPNPANNSCTVNAKEFINAALAVYDITGRVMLQQNFNETAQLNLNKLKSGIYIIEIKNMERTVKGKIIKE